MLECIGVFILVFCIVFGGLMLLDGGESAIMNECKKIGDENTRRSMEIIYKDFEEIEKKRNEK